MSLPMMLIWSVVISLLQPKSESKIRLPTEPDEPLQPEPSLTHLPPPPDNDSTKPHSPRLDIAIARVSTLIQLTAYILMTFTTGSLMFVLFTTFCSFGIGVSPAVQSVNLSLYTSRGEIESGRLLGALTVVSVVWCVLIVACAVQYLRTCLVSSQIIGPAAFGFTYATTVTFFPQAIFLVCGIIMIAVFLILTLVR